MVSGEPTFAGVTLSQFMQLPKGVTVTLAGAGGQAPIISLTDPAALLPKSLQTPRTSPQIGAAGHLSLASAPGGGDTFTTDNPLGTNAPVPLSNPGGNAQGEDRPGPGRGNGKGRHGGGPPGLMKKGGLPPGLAKQQAKGKPLPPGNPWGHVLPLSMPSSAELQSNRQLVPPSEVPLTPPQQPQTVHLPGLLESASMSGLPRPTQGLSPEPGAIVQFGPPLA